MQFLANLTLEQKRLCAGNIYLKKSKILWFNHQAQIWSLESKFSLHFRDGVNNVYYIFLKFTFAPFLGVSVDGDDIEVKYSFNYNGKINVTDLKARVFSIRIDHQDIFYFILEFAPIDLDRNSSPGGLKGIYNAINYEGIVFIH